MDFPDTVPEGRTRRITVYSEGNGSDAELVQQYAATQAEAWDFATAATLSGLSVIVDGMVRPGLCALPERRHWPHSHAWLAPANDPKESPTHIDIDPNDVRTGLRSRYSISRRSPEQTAGE